MRTAYVFLNGELQGSGQFYRDFMTACPGDVFCADGGLYHAEKLGILPVEIFGDFDSTDGETLSFYEKKGVVIRRFPVRKDETDGELILGALSGRQYDKIYLLAASGGRTDHFLMNAFLLFRFPQAEFLSERERVFAIFGKYTLCGCKGKTVSLLPFSETVEELTLRGFSYPLRQATVSMGSSLCMSNVAAEDRCGIEFSKGMILCVVETIT